MFCPHGAEGSSVRVDRVPSSAVGFVSVKFKAHTHTHAHTEDREDFLDECTDYQKFKQEV